MATANPPQLVPGALGSDASRRNASEGLALHPSATLDGFIGAAAAAGLSLGEAVRLGVERVLVLSDAGKIGDSEIARRRLCAAASAARPQMRIATAEAARVRALSMPQSVAPTAVRSRVVIPLPNRILARARNQVPSSALCRVAVPEMVSWEIAATLEGRTMGEWALRLLLAGT